MGCTKRTSTLRYSRLSCHSSCKTLNLLVDSIPTEFLLTFSALLVPGACPEFTSVTIRECWMWQIVLCECHIGVTSDRNCYKFTPGVSEIRPNFHISCSISIVNKAGAIRCPIRHTCSEPTTTESSGSFWRIPTSAYRLIPLPFRKLNPPFALGLPEYFSSHVITSVWRQDFGPQSPAPFVFPSVRSNSTLEPRGFLAREWAWGEEAKRRRGERRGVRFRIFASCSFVSEKVWIPGQSNRWC